MVNLCVCVARGSLFHFPGRITQAFKIWFDTGKQILFFFWYWHCLPFVFSLVLILLIQIFEHCLFYDLCFCQDSLWFFPLWFKIWYFIPGKEKAPGVFSVCLFVCFYISARKKNEWNFRKSSLVVLDCQVITWGAHILWFLKEEKHY